MGNDVVRNFLYRYPAGLLAACCWLTGCGDPAGPLDGPSPEGSPPPGDAGTPLTLLVVDDAGLAEAIPRAWSARAKGKMVVRQVAGEELLQSNPQRLNADAVIYPAAMIGELAEANLIVPLGADVLKRDDFDPRDVFELIRHHEITWGESVFAVPLGSPPLMLLYRPDIFASLQLQPPADWHAYQRACERLGQASDLGETNGIDRADWSATCEPLGAGWAGQMLLARVAGYARHRSYFATLFDLQNMEPRIAEPPFVRALSEMVAAAPFLPENASDLSPGDARERLQSGKCAMAVTWPTAAAAADGGTAALDVSELPGSSTVYHPGESRWQPRTDADTTRVPLLSVAGRLGSVAQGARHPQLAQTMLLRISGRDWSAEISPASSQTTLYRTSQLGDAGKWMGPGFDADAVRDYGQLIRECLRRPQSLSSPRLPGRSLYLAALDEAVQRALAAEASPEECLAAAAERWREITQQLGLDAQRDAFGRSVGLEP